MIPVTLEIERFLSVYIPPPFAVTGGVGVVVVPASDPDWEDSVPDPDWGDAGVDSGCEDAANEFYQVILVAIRRLFSFQTCQIYCI